MSPRDQDLMERYIYAVTRRLPRAQREEIADELWELIGDMLEADPAAGMEGVLLELGDPAEFAGRYASPDQCLIGPAYFENYKWLLKVVLLCATIPVSLLSLASGVIEHWTDGFYQAIVRGLTDGITNAVTAGLTGFGAVTLVFAAVERYERRGREGERRWTPADLREEPSSARFREARQPSAGKFSASPPSWDPSGLSPVPDKKARISRGDSIASIVFIVIFCALLVFIPNLFFLVISREGIDGNWLLSSEIDRIPIFNLDEWGRILPFFVLSLGIGLADEVIRLVRGCYCRTVMVSSILCGGVQLVLSVWILKFLPLFNPELPERLAEARETLGDAAWVAGWNGELVTSFLLALIVLITLLEMGTTVYKTLRYAPKAA